ncbi:MAG: hypothetical protein J7M38_05850 [Armatimonadetes bacterium]|nr:hypothetical protein [Armatimonadota bacterium]
MGTSTWHRSPSTPEWDRVRELYSRRDPDPREIVRRIVGALDPATRERMKAPAVVTSLGVLLEGTRLVADVGLSATLASLGVDHDRPALQMAAGLRNRAEAIIAQAEQASRFGDLALEAVGTTAMAIATLHDPAAGLLEAPLPVVEANFASLHRDGRHHELAAGFLSHDLDRAFRHFVARDVTDFIGGEGIPTVSHASRLEDGVARVCRDELAGLDLSSWQGALAEAASLEPTRWQEPLAPVISAGLDIALATLGGVA